MKLYRVYELKEGERFRYKGNVYTRGPRTYSNRHGVLYACCLTGAGVRNVVGLPFMANFEVVRV